MSLDATLLCNLLYWGRFTVSYKIRHLANLKR